LASKPIPNTLGSGIVRGCCEAEISKFATQAAQQLAGLRNCCERIERVFETARSCRCRHELSYALCTFPADRVRLEAAFLPDQAGEEIDRQIIGRCRRGEGLSKTWRCRWAPQLRPAILFRPLISLRLAVFSGGLLLYGRRLIANVRCEDRPRGHSDRRGQEQYQQEVGTPTEGARR